QAACRNYLKAFTITKDNRIKASARLGAGWAYLKLKKYKEAQDLFSEINSDALDQKSADILSLGKAILCFQDNRIYQSKKIYAQILASSKDPAMRLEAYLGLADACNNLMEYPLALDAYRQALAIAETTNLKNSEIISGLKYKISQVYLKSGKLREGSAEIMKIVQSEADQNLKTRLLCALGDAYLAQADLVQAKQAYSEIIKNYPHALGADYAQYQLAVIALKRIELSDVILNLTDFAKIYPVSELNGQAVYMLALAYFQNKDYVNCLKTLGQFKDFPEASLEASAIYLSANSLMNLERFNEAIAGFKKIINRFSQEQELLQKAEYQLADCYYRMNNETEAVAKFKALRSKYPDSNFAPEVIWWLGEYYYRKGDLTLARRYFSSLINDYPKSGFIGNAYYILGKTYLNERKFSLARDNFEHALKVSGKENRKQVVLAFIDSCFGEGQSSQAAACCQGLLNKYPELSGSINIKLGDIYYQDSNYIRAAECYRESLKNLPLEELSAIQFKLAESLEAIGDLKSAAFEYQSAAGQEKTAEGFSRPLLRAAKIYEEEGAFSQALDVYQRIIQADIEESDFAREKAETIKQTLKK
ncbi:MAG: tetratricopeptide repeat protein, partial [Candidatus Omnitrophica bacterium]|nr:tetratricopeptide repeat protein [Candidatus Omnitrophota bacterium]